MPAAQVENTNRPPMLVALGFGSSTSIRNAEDMEPLGAPVSFTPKPSNTNRLNTSPFCTGDCTPPVNRARNSSKSMLVVSLPIDRHVADPSPTTFNMVLVEVDNWIML